MEIFETNLYVLLLGVLVAILGMAYCISEIIETRRIIKHLEEIERCTEEYMFENSEEEDDE